jgi:hypothetical protein
MTTQSAPSAVPPQIRPDSTEAPATEAPATEAPAAPDSPAARQRDAHLDNAKFLGVILVVCGHVLEDLRDAHGAHALYLFIYMFHMPCRCSSCWPVTSPGASPFPAARHAS